jgi:hypothetical protein
MRSDDTKFERLAVEQDARRASEGAEPPAQPSSGWVKSDPGYGLLRAREAAVIDSPAVVDRYRVGVDRLLNKLVHVLFTLDEQRSEIVRLRENTRQVLARLSAV